MLLSESSFKSDFNKMRVNNQCKTSRASSSSSTGSSLFTIDSILAPRPSVSNSVSPQINNNRQQNSAVPTAVMHHPIHLGHIAAAASTFGTHSDFLGKTFSFFPPFWGLSWDISSFFLYLFHYFVILHVIRRATTLFDRSK